MSARPRQPSAAGFVTALFGLFVAWPFLVPGRWVTSFDGIAYTGAQASVTFEALRSFRLPGWNELVFGGVNHLGNVQTSAYYPLAWVVAHLDVHRGLMVAAAIHVGALGLGTWVLLRHRLGLAAVASAGGTITLLGSGVVVSRVVQHEQIGTMAWIPWVLVATDLILASTRPWRAVAAVAASVAVLLVAGHPQQAYLAAPLVVAWSIGRAIDRGSLRRLPLLVLGGLLGVGIAAIQLVPVASTLGAAARSGGTDLTIVRTEAYNVQPENLPLSLLGDVAATSHTAALESTEAVGFVGAVAGALAVLGAVAMARRGPHRATAIVLTVCVAVAVWLSLGPAAGLYRALYEVVPGFSQARTPARWLLVSVVATTVLGAGALDRIVRADVDRRSVVATSVVAGGGLAVALLAPFTRPSGWGVAGWILGTTAVVAAAWALVRPSAPTSRLAASPVLGVLLLVLLVAELGWMQTHSVSRAALTSESFTARAERVEVPVPEPVGWTLSLADERFSEPDYLLRTLRPNANVLTGYPTIDGYDGGPVVTARWVDAVSMLTWRPFRIDLTMRAQTFDPVDPAHAARLGIRWLVLETEGRDPARYVPDWGGPVAVDGTVHVYENPRWIGPARLVGNVVERVDDRAAIPEQLASLPPDTVAVDDPDATADVDCGGTCDPIALDVVREERDRVRIALPEQLDDVRLLVVEQQLADGWTATVDGEARDVLEVDRLLTGVVVRPGDQEVVLSFRAPGRTAGLLVSVVALVLTLACAIAGDRLRPLNPTSTAVDEPGGAPVP
ncbi:hypothetical protein [Actinomarinicola tropica]|uniref:YfhO family protein n=1 Tax=Actinomarinicola tropica TaxID=2789776 RepID=A0A5Q2RGB1_9ACTN|nr:hypothetical protein [Actinomarinicola tropica]QGG95838.1 hypothetical protein GH723_12425 [Actinomarinicola tropica]